MQNEDSWLSESNTASDSAKQPESAAARKKSGPMLAPPTEVTPTKKKLNHHWARPIFLQYGYLYNYYHNYYDDYIDYMDRRQRGLEVEKPRPQTWAERALRTYTRDTYPFSSTYRLPRRTDSGTALLNTPHWANTWHSEHSKDYYNRKYKAILY